MNKINYFFVVFLLAISMMGQEEYTVSDFRDVENLLLNAGDVVVVKDGVYSDKGSVDIYAEGTALEPIIIRPESPGGVVFTGSMRVNLAGSYIIIDGFHWKEGDGANNFIQLRAKNFEGIESYAQNCTIQNCVIDGLKISEKDAIDDQAKEEVTKHRWIVLYGNFNTIINCSFMNKESAGASILVELFYNNSCDVVGHTISNNYFFNYKKIDPDLGNAGDSEAIRVGTSSYQNYNCATTVSNNYFVQTDGENEIISNKSSNNVYSNNTFRRCRGSLVLRHGAAATVNKNYFLGENVDGTGGLRIVDSDHVITNNYIQDCITVESQAKWNNGFTFMGGAVSSVDNCVSGSISNGYQKSENNYVSNNTIINTNAPFFYNGDKGTERNTGVVENNLIFFKDSNSNLSPVISEDDPNDYVNLGSTLTYKDNVFGGAVLGEVNNGFLLVDISLEENGEIYMHNQIGKGADMGGFEPHTDAMVGNGVGACFLNYNGESISQPNCTIVAIDKLNVGSLVEFEVEGGSQSVVLNTNVTWVAEENLDWVTISSNSGMGDALITVTVAVNPERIARSGVISFSQEGGGLSAILNVRQLAPELTELYTLINTGDVNDAVVIVDFSKEQVGFDDGKERFNYATNTLDKDISTRWAANDLDDVPDGDVKADGEYIIYDLGKVYDLGLIQLSTDEGKDHAYGYQIWMADSDVPYSGLSDSDFTKVLPGADVSSFNLDKQLLNAEELMFTEVGTDDYQQTEISVGARYVKLVGFGRFNADRSKRESVWTNITEVEFFAQKDSSLSVEENLFNEVLMYPVPVRGIINFKNLKKEIDKISVVSLEGKEVFYKSGDLTKDVSLDVSSLKDGVYIVNLFSESNNLNSSKTIVIQH